MPKANSKYIMNESELNILMQKGCKGFVTELAKIAANRLQKNAEAAFAPGHSYLTNKDRIAKKPYQSGNGKFASTVKYDSRTENLGDAFSNMAYFDSNEIEDMATDVTREYLGRYVDVKNNGLDGNYLVGILEEGTEGKYQDDSKMKMFERKGAKFMEKTIQDIESYLNSTGIETIIEAEFSERRGGLTITRYK